MEGSRNRTPGISEQILDALEAGDGLLPLNDDNPAEEIMRRFGISKKTCKKAIGALFKERRIRIGEDGIRIARTGPEHSPTA